MKYKLLHHRASASWLLAIIAASAFAFVTSAAHAGAPIFASTNSDSDILGVALVTDTETTLVNPWGLTPGPEGNLHVNINGAGVNGHYAPSGALISGTAIPHTFTIPQATVTSGSIGSPSGIVLNKLSYWTTGTNDFVITGTGGSGPSNYLIATEDGAICGYNRNVDSSAAIKAYDGSASGAGYTGAALSFAMGPNGLPEHRLYAANFRAGTVDVFDSKFTPVALTGSNTFTDPDLPTPPTGLSWSPFNVHHIAFMGGPAGTRPTLQLRILVAYALHSTTSNVMNDVPGVGNGAVAVFTPGGQFLRELAPANGLLNSPWGMAIAHVTVGSCGAHDFVLVGNHGDGMINNYAFDAGAKEGFHIGTLENAVGNPLAFDGLWALHFGPKKESLKDYLGDVNDMDEDDVNLYFSAGLLGESHGLVGRIIVPGIH